MQRPKDDQILSPFVSDEWMPRQHLIINLSTHLSYLQEDEEVEDCEGGEGDDVHEHQVHPGNVDGDVAGIGELHMVQKLHILVTFVGN